MARRTERERVENTAIDAIESISSSTVSPGHLLVLNGRLSGVDFQWFVSTYRQLSRDLHDATDQQTIHHIVSIEEALRERAIDPDTIVRYLMGRMSLTQMLHPTARLQTE